MNRRRATLFHLSMLIMLPVMAWSFGEPPNVSSYFQGAMWGLVLGTLIMTIANSGENK